ncbi:MULTISPECIES: tyrosine-type recombinase/integrase [unclassified Rhizobium]|uniref:tyrosine-type recombinase/integrase n=1 Tax=unclassified Rhizobium TaxID=2613769 RepID=UPI00216723CD|nr:MULTISPECIES: tyrosine-type recombinase/integrase [unclassified Rhizobium]MCS3742606.1 integrase [Rhizobium sp. BK661]MCS4094572.1 integrase [Rhizobium sp. BK176]
MARKQRFEQWAHVHQLKNGKLIFRHALTGQRTLPDDMESPEFAREYEKLRLLVAGPAEKPKPVVKRVTFQDCYDEFTRSDEWRGFTMNTIRSYRTNSAHFLQARLVGDSKSVFGKAFIDTPESEMLPVLRDHIERLKPNKGKKQLEIIRKIYATAVRKKWCLRNLGNDIENVRLPKHKPQRKWPQEVMDQFEAHHPLGSRARTCFALARFLGCRAGDVAAVRWDQIRPHRYIDESGEVRVVSVIEFWTRKNMKRGSNSHITLIIRPELEAVLNSLDRSRGGMILKSSRGEAYNEDSLSLRMAVWLREAGITEKGLSMYGLRRGFASELAMGQADLFTVQKSMGHKSPQTTAIYLNQLDPLPLAEAAIAAAERRTAQIKRLKAVEN